MSKQKLKNEIFIGVVVDNKDPKKTGRCKIKVFQVFDKLEIADIPWATPWKDLNGNQFILPEVGKVVSVVFDQGNKYTPEYIYAQNYNINLENKLKSLNEEDYTSMRAILFDHSTQIYRNTTEGLKIDHEYSNINIEPSGNIALNLRDNQSVITLGSADAREQAVLGTTFLSWLDSLVQSLLGAEGGAYITESGSPVAVGPGLSQALMSFAQLKDTFLSRQVRISANGEILEQQRPYLNQKGDADYATVLPPTERPRSEIIDPQTGERVNYQRREGSVEYDSKQGSDIYGSDEPIIPPIGMKGNPASMKAAGSLLFQKNGGKKGLCALYTYSIARNYIEHLKNGSCSGSLYGGKGNANDANYRNNLVRLGYSVTPRQVVKKSTLRNIIRTTQWTIGDIINYRCLCNVDGWADTYGHTQIYHDGLLANSKWASSFANNYNSELVYSSGENCDWEYFIFRKL
jgi:hypothetical protein